MVKKDCFKVEGYYLTACCRTCDFAIEHDPNEELEIIRKDVESRGGKLSKFDEKIILQWPVQDTYCSKHDMLCYSIGKCNECGKIYNKYERDGNYEDCPIEDCCGCLEKVPTMKITTTAMFEDVNKSIKREFERLDSAMAYINGISSIKEVQSVKMLVDFY